MQRPNYRINPSLLNSFWDLVNSETLYDKLYGQTEDAMTPEEFYAKQEQELLDSINRIEHEPIEAADRGTCLNEIIDCILEHRKPAEGIELQTIRDPEGRPLSIAAKMHGFYFNFDANLCMELAGYFRGSVCQHLCEAVIDTAYGPVVLYGYADYIRRDIVYDLKTTSRYEYGKYGDGFQKDLYPWCLLESGELEAVSEFEYTAIPIKGGNGKNPLIGGDIIRERYDYDHEQATQRLRGSVEMFIAWIEQHRDQIHHTRIFNK